MMKTLMAVLVLAAICYLFVARAADKPPAAASTNLSAAAVAADRRDRRTLANEFSRKVDRLNAADLATVKAILNRYPAIAPHTNAPALKK